MNEVLKCLKERRTIRRFLKEQIAEQELHYILEAGLYAPTAGGRQSPQILVCQDADVNGRLGRLNRKLFGGANSDGIHFVSPTQRSIADDDSIESGFYDAPTVVTLFAPERWVYGIHDCTSVAINMMTAAWSLGIGCCYVSRAEETFRTDLGRELQQRAGIAEHYVARVHICMGYPDGEAVAKERKMERIHFVK